MLRRLVLILAWIFAAGSLATLALIIVLHWPGSGGTSSIMTITADGRDYTGPGFRYVGVGGTVLAVGEAVLVLAGIVLSVLRATVPCRVGHAILTAWSALWLVDGVYLAVAAAAGLTAFETVLLIVVPLMTCAATVTRAGLVWARRSEP